MRQSRRWRTWAIRGGFSLVLIGSLLIGTAIAVDRMNDVSQIGETGRILFFVYSGLQLLLVAGLAPVLVASGVLEEKDDRTLELLVISRLGAADILWGKVGSRLLTLATLVVGGLPVLTLVLSLGGVSPWQVINATSATLLIALVLGVVSGFVALFARGPMIPVTVALLFGLIVMLGVPSASGQHYFNPIVAAYHTDAGGLVMWIPWLPVLWQLGVLGGPVMRIVTTDDSEDEFGMLSPDIWVLERFQRRTALMWLVVIGAGMFSWLLDGILGVFGVRWAGAVLALWWAGWTVALVFAVSTSFLLATLRTVLASRNRAARSARARASQAELSGRSRRVWSNPVMWKEVRDTGITPLRAGLFVACWLLLLILWGVLVDQSIEPIAAIMIGASLLIAPPLVAASAIEDRRRRTLPLLLITPMATWRITMGKVLGPLSRLTVLVVLGYATWMLATTQWLGPETHEPRYWGTIGSCAHEHLLGPNIGTGHLTAIVATATWHGTLLVLLATGSVALATRMPRSLAWPSVAAFTVAWAVGPLIAAAITETLALPRPIWLIRLWLPIGGSRSGFDCVSGGAPRWLLAVAALQVLAILGLGAIASRGLERLRWHSEG